MNTFLLFFLIGLGAGIIVFPIFLFFYIKIKNAKERRRIKRLLKQGKFLTPVDSRDYDVEAWKNQRYGNIDIEAQKPYFNNLNKNIFKTADEENKPVLTRELTQEEKFIIKAQNYAEKARAKGYTEEQIKQEFRNKNYKEELINKIIQNGRT